MLWVRLACCINVLFLPFILEPIYELTLLYGLNGFIRLRLMMGCDCFLLEPINVNTLLHNQVINQHRFGWECSIDQSCTLFPLRFAGCIYSSIGRYNCNQAAIISQEDRHMLLFASECSEADTPHLSFELRTCCYQKVLSAFLTGLWWRMVRGIARYATFQRM